MGSSVSRSTGACGLFEFFCFFRRSNSAFNASCIIPVFFDIESSYISIVVCSHAKTSLTVGHVEFLRPTDHR